MMKRLKLIAIASVIVSPLLAQEVTDSTAQAAIQDEQAFTFTEAQLGEDDDMSQNVTIINSNNNIYASQVGYLFSPVRFRYRAFNQKYNEIFINGAPMNDMESGQFRYSLVGGLNQQTRGVENSLPFEVNNFAMSAMGGSNNYNFRPSAMTQGQRITLTGANRNYNVRAMYTYNSGISSKDGPSLPISLTDGQREDTLRGHSTTHSPTSSAWRRSSTTSTAYLSSPGATPQSELRRAQVPTKPTGWQTTATTTHTGDTRTARSALHVSLPTGLLLLCSHGTGR